MHASIAFKVTIAVELNVDDLFLVLHIYVMIQTQTKLLCIMYSMLMIMVVDSVSRKQSKGGTGTCSSGLDRGNWLGCS